MLGTQKQWKFSVQFLLTIFLTPNVLAFPNTTSLTPTQAGCPTIQFSSDTIYLVSVTSYKLRAQSHKTDPTSDASHKSQVIISASDWLAINSRGSSDSLIRFVNCSEWLIELRKILYLLSPAYYKGCNSGRARWKRLIGQGIGSTQCFHTLSR